ncbi:MAG: TRAP transporter large permease subunit [Propionibacteriales bacterium]|nr:TRAP transporter large permease subunit [Propionibacteriales bacterium]
MDLTIVAIVLAILVLLLVAEIPVAFALLVSGATGLALLSGTDVAGSSLARLPFESTAKYTLVVIPMFVAMGVFAKQGGMAIGLFRLASRALRGVPGGLALAALVACAGFAAVSGSSVATVVSIGRLSIEEMRKLGYSATFAAGVIGATGTLGVLIPPSVILVIYGVLTGESIGALLIAGILPGLLSVVLYALAIIYRAYRHPEQVGREPRSARAGDSKDADATAWSSATTSERSVSASTLAATAAASETARSGQRVETDGTVADSEREDAAPSDVDPMERNAPGGWGGVLRIGILFTIVVGGIYSGIFTAIESAAVGAAAALVILVVDSIRISIGVLWQRFRDGIIEAVSINSMVFMLLIGAGVFSTFIVTAGIPAAFTNFAVGLDVSPWLVVTILVLAFIPLGMFLDPISMMLIGVPLAYPVVTALGFDGLWFGIIVVVMIEVGFITPPLGINAYVVAGTVKDISVETAFRGILWFLPVNLLTIVILFLFPQIVLWLPAAVR